MHTFLNPNTSLGDTLQGICKMSQQFNPMQVNWKRELQILPEMGRLHIAPLKQFMGGPVQTYYEQGYNTQDYQYQPLAKE
jgi:hypothetical protein